MRDEMNDTQWDDHFKRKARERGEQIPCPFHKPDVAYMPVPRCETCHWWSRISDTRGECGQVYQIDQSVPPNFGCVEWKEKA